MAADAQLQQFYRTNVRFSITSATGPNRQPRSRPRPRETTPAPARPEVARPPAGIYPKHLEEYRRLPGGGTVHLRPIRPEDEAGLRAGFKKLTAEDVRRRFFVPMAELSPRLAAQLCRIDYDRHMALVAIGLDPKGGTDGWGVARLVVDPAGGRAEFAIVVRSDVQRRGVASLLLDRLLAYAEARGIGVVWGNVPADNHAMLAFAGKRGFRIAPSPEERGAMRVSKDLSVFGPPVQEPFA
jgi:acetyltransferase